MAPVLKVNKQNNLKTFRGKRISKVSILPSTHDSTFDRLLGINKDLERQKIFESSSEREKSSELKLQEAETSNNPWIFLEESIKVTKSVQRQKCKNKKGSTISKKKKDISNKSKSNKSFTLFLRKIYEERQKRKAQQSHLLLGDKIVPIGASSPTEKEFNISTPKPAKTSLQILVSDPFLKQISGSSLELPSAIEGKCSLTPISRITHSLEQFHIDTGKTEKTCYQESQDEVQEENQIFSEHRSMKLNSDFQEVQFLPGFSFVTLRRKKNNSQANSLKLTSEGEVFLEASNNSAEIENLSAELFPNHPSKSPSCSVSKSSSEAELSSQSINSLSNDELSIPLVNKTNDEPESEESFLNHISNTSSSIASLSNKECLSSQKEADSELDTSNASITSEDIIEQSFHMENSRFLLTNPKHPVFGSAKSVDLPEVEMASTPDLSKSSPIFMGFSSAELHRAKRQALRRQYSDETPLPSREMFSSSIRNVFSDSSFKARKEKLLSYDNLETRGRTNFDFGGPPFLNTSLSLVVEPDQDKDSSEENTSTYLEHTSVKRKSYATRRMDELSDEPLPAVPEDEIQEHSGESSEESTSSYLDQPSTKRKTYVIRRIEELSDDPLPVVLENEIQEHSGESSIEETMEELSSRQESGSSPVSSRQESPVTPCSGGVSMSGEESVRGDELQPVSSDSPSSPKHSVQSDQRQTEPSSSEDESGSSPVREHRRSDRRRPSKLPRRTLGYIAEESESDTALSECDSLPPLQEQFYLMTGKKYRRSLSIIHHLSEEMSNISSSYMKGRKYQDSVEQIIKLQGKSERRVRQSLDGIKKVRKSMRISTYTSKCYSEIKTRQEQTEVEPVIRYSSNFQNASSLESENNFQQVIIGESPELVVKMICDQTEPCTFDEVLSVSLDSCKKIGEGVYGEVYMLKRPSQNVVLKIIPIEGDFLVNGEYQKSYDQIVYELIITKETSDLRDLRNSNFRCDGFVELVKAWLISGSYHSHLIKCWEEFDSEKGSDNDNPTVFPEKQLYLALELAHSGQDLESYRFSSAQQALSAFKQVVFSLAVAEGAFEFEHRDLHWGNILISRTKQRSISYILNGNCYEVKTNGVKATIIDYTLSGMTLFHNICNQRIFFDIGKDEDLFMGKGDLQFEVYRQMKADLDNNWSIFIAKTNVRWLHYLVDKLTEKAFYQRKNCGVHRKCMSHMKQIRTWVLECNTSYEVALEILNIK